jgi:hypothetical protein
VVCCRRRSATGAKRRAFTRPPGYRERFARNASCG